MQHGLVADGAIIANGEREIYICVDNHIFLDVAALANGDGFIVSAQHGTKPDAGLFCQADLADKTGCWGDPTGLAVGKGWGLVFKTVKGHLVGLE